MEEVLELAGKWLEEIKSIRSTLNTLDQAQYCAAVTQLYVSMTSAYFRIQSKLTKEVFATLQRQFKLLHSESQETKPRGAEKVELINRQNVVGQIEEDIKDWSDSMTLNMQIDTLIQGRWRMTYLS